MFYSGNFWSGVKNKLIDGATIKPACFENQRFKPRWLLSGFSGATAHVAGERLSNMAAV
jgi:hypothetical protein